MKKTITILLALLMMATFSVSAFAASADKSENIDVKAEYKDNSTTTDEISVDISWGAMEFTYTVSGEKNWNANEHKYDDNTKAAWTAKGNTVTVTNHSNVAVTTTFSFSPLTDYTGISGSFSNKTLTLKSAAGVGTDEASLKTLTGTTDLTLSGSLKSGTVQGTKVGTITVDIKKNAQ